MVSNFIIFLNFINVEMENIKLRLFNFIQTYIFNECCKKEIERTRRDNNDPQSKKELECMLLWLNELYDKLQFILKKKLHI